MIGVLLDGPDPAIEGGDLTLEAAGVMDDSLGVSVAFYRDADGDGVFDATTDQLLGRDVDVNNGWGILVSTEVFGRGPQTYFAQAMDEEGLVSEVMRATGSVGIVGVIDNSEPGYEEWIYEEFGAEWTDGALPDSYKDGHREHTAGAGENGARWTFNGLTEGPHKVYVTWPAHETHASNSPFSVYDGTVLENSYLVDQRVSPADVYDGQAWWHYLGTFDVESGQLAVELSDDADGVVVADAVRVLDPPPEIGSLSSDRDRVVQGDPIVLTAHDVVDSDGTVSSVAFYRDANANGTLEIESDDLVGIDTVDGDGWRVVAQTSGFASGAQTYFARATDNDAMTSDPISVEVTVLADVTDGLAGHWRLNEASGTTAEDSAGTNDGTLFGGAVWSDGQAGGALEFDGVNDYVALGDPAELDITGEITLAAWVRVEATNGLRDIVVHGHSPSPQGEVVLRVKDGQYEVGSWNGTNHMTSYAIPAEDMGSWVHLAGLYDGTAWRLYRNGVEVSATAEPTGAVSVNENWAIGARGTGTERFFQGQIDEVRIYDRALKAAEVQALVDTAANARPVVEDQLFGLPVDSGDGALAGTVIATDPNPGDTLTYAITAGNNDGVFGIDGATGEITVADSSVLDFGTNPVYYLTVEVTDDGDPVLSDTATVSVVGCDLADGLLGYWKLDDAGGVTAETAVNDPPVFLQSNDREANAESELLVSSHVWDAEDIYFATDPDDPFGGLVFGLGAGAPDGVEVDPEFGTLTWTPTVEQVSASPYSVTVIVTDSGGLSAQATFNITVGDPLPANPNLLINGSFEDPVVVHDSDWNIYSTIPGWTLVSSAPLIELHHPDTQPSGPFITPADGYQYLELDADENGPDDPDLPYEQGAIAVQQAVETQAGTTYELSFAAAARPGTSASENKVEVRVYDTGTWQELDLVASANSPALDGNNQLTAYSSSWEYYTLAFQAEGSWTTVYFAYAGDNDDTLGAYVDDAEVKKAPPRVIKVEFIDPATLNLDNIDYRDRYGRLTADNPTADQNNDGEVSGDELHRMAPTQPDFGGGHRFFPDADVKKPEAEEDGDAEDPEDGKEEEVKNSEGGKNIVRVRATLENGTIGETVWFRTFDVDDPTNNKIIDPNGPTGNDNRGRMKGVHEPGPSKTANAGGYVGGLQAINEGEVPAGGWISGKNLVPAIVKALKDKAGVVQTENGEPVLVAEVDLATTFAPGDNFRVGAVPNTANAKKSLQNLDVVPIPDTPPDEENPDAPPAEKKFFVDTNNEHPNLTEQLSIWRYLHIEVDSRATVDVTGLMTPGTTNRQQNRFADAYIEPEYESLQAINTTPLPYGARATFWNNMIHPNDETVVENARDTKTDLESRTCWIAYVGAELELDRNQGNALITGRISGLTGNNHAKSPYEWSLIFSLDIADFYRDSGAAAIQEAIQKVAVHEVAHQFFDSDKHHGTFRSLVGYYNANDAQKNRETWINVVNIMNENAILVPMNNAAASIPLYVRGANEGNSAGPIDRFYFVPGDIAKLRKQTVSP